SLKFDVKMMGFDGVDDFPGFAVLPSNLYAQLEVGSFHVTINGFADVVKQSGTLADFHIGTQFSRHDCGKICYVTAVIENVLPVTGSIPESAQQAENFVVKLMDSQLESNLLALLSQVLLHVALNAGHYLFNARWMNSAILDQLLD